MNDDDGWKTLALYAIVALALWALVSNVTRDGEWQGMLMAVGSIGAVFLVNWLRS